MGSSTWVSLFLSCLCCYCCFFFLSLFNFLLVLCEFHMSHSSPCPFVSGLCPATSPQKKTKHLPKTNPNNKIPHHSSYSVSHSMPFCPDILLANVHYNESLVWFQASDFCYIISSDPFQAQHPFQ